MLLMCWNTFYNKCLPSFFILHKSCFALHQSTSNYSTFANRTSFHRNDGTNKLKLRKQQQISKYSNIHIELKKELWLTFRPNFAPHFSQSCGFSFLQDFFYLLFVLVIAHFWRGVNKVRFLCVVCDQPMRSESPLISWLDSKFRTGKKVGPTYGL